MRILGIDHGLSNLGIAIGDDELYIASPFDTIKEKELEKQISSIEQIVLDEQIEKVIVGLPLSMEGGESDQTESTLSFITQLSGTLSIPVERVDERLSSSFGKKMQQQEGSLFDDHSLAAMAILQTYLDKRKME